MNIKKIIGAISLLGVGYGLGKIKGYIDISKLLLDIAEENLPGSKRAFAETVSDYIINKMFADEQNKSKKES